MRFLASLLLGLFSIYPLLSSASSVERVHCGLYLTATRALDPAKKELHWIERGNPANPKLILIHGLGGGIKTWDTSLETLSQKFHVIAYDQRGHGWTVARGENYGTHTLARDLEALMNHLRIEKAHLIGSSMGARTAARFLQLHPERVLSLIVEDMDFQSRANHAPRYQNHILAMARNLSQELRTRKFTRLQDYQKFLEPYFSSDLDQVASKWAIARDNDNNLHTRGFYLPAFMLASVQAMSEALTDTLETPGAEHVPLLFLRGDPEAGWSAMSDAGVAAILKARPDAHVATIPGADHRISRTQLQLFLTAVVDFYRAMEI